MRERERTKRIFLRCVQAVLLLACMVVCVCGCGPEEPQDTSFFIAKDADGAEFRLGEKGETVGRLELPRGEDGEFTGDVKLYCGDEIWLRVWQESDHTVQKVYLQTPDGAMLLDSWVDEEVPLHAGIKYNGAGAQDMSSEGVNLTLELPQKNDDTCYVLLSINNLGTLQLNVYVDRKVSDGVYEQTSEAFLYRFVDNTWSAKDRVASVSRQQKSSTDPGLSFGTYTISVDIARDGSSRQLLWERTGFGADGSRYRVTCTQDAKQIALLQTYDNSLGDVVVEAIEFSGAKPISADEDGRVRRDGAIDLLNGEPEEHTYAYNGNFYSGQMAEAIKSGSVAGFASSLLRTDEIYEGNRAADGLLTRPQYRKYVFLQFHDDVTNTTVEVPVAYGDWKTPDKETCAAEVSAAKLTLQPYGENGWTLLSSPADGGDAQGNPEASNVGAIELGSMTDPTGTTVYSGDVKITVDDAPEFRLYRRCVGETCYVYAEFDGTQRLLAACPAENGAAPALSVSRYVEVGDYNTPLTLYKLFYAVRLPDGTEVAQFLLTNRGQLAVRLKADPTLQEPSEQENPGDGEDAQGGDAQDTQSTDGRGNDAPDDAGDSAQSGSTADGRGAVKADANAADRKATNIEVMYTFRCAADRVAVSTSVTEKVVRDGITLEGATERTYTASGKTVKIKVKTESATSGDQFGFYCDRDDASEALMTVTVSGGLPEGATVQVRDEGLGSTVPAVSIRGGLLYAGEICIDSMTINGSTGDDGASSGEYRPSGDHAVYETENLIVRLRSATEYRSAEKTQEGIVIAAETARRIVWVEFTECSSGDSWSFPVGFGQWQQTQ